MLKEKVAKMMKLAAASMMLTLGVAAVAPAVQVDAAMLEESEPNDNPATANKLPLNTWVKGIANEEQDWYEINIPKQGISYLEIKPDEENTRSSAEWGIKLVDENRNVLWNFQSNEGKKTTTWEGGWAPGKYYLVISGYAYPYVHGEYNLMFHYQESDQWEKEFYYGSKNFSNANIVDVNKWYTGNLYCGNDTDYYRFKLDGTNKVSLDFKIDDIVANPGKWYVHFYEYGTRKDLGYTEVTTNRTLTTECTGDVVVSFSTDAYSNSAVNQRYHIQASVVSQNKIDSNTTITPTPVPGNNTTNNTTTVQKPSATKITSIKPGKKQATIRWKKASNATGYYVYRSTKAKGGYKKIATVNGKTTYKDKKALKSKKTYYYKVISYRKNGSKVLKSKASGYKRVKIK